MMVERQLIGKYRFFIGLVVAVFLVLILRLGALQIWEASLYRTKAEQNQFRFLPIHAPRGDIVDRNGKILANNKIVNTVSIVPMQIPAKDLQKTVNNLASMMQDVYPDVTAAFINKQLNDHKGLSYQPVAIKRDISIDVVTRLEERRSDLPGVLIAPEAVRYYPNSGLASHILGYVGEISQTELDKNRDENYKLGDLVGRYGLESQYEKYLRGQDGFQQVEVDVNGRPLANKNLLTVQPKQGDKLVLTIDSDLQKVMEDKMDQVLAKLRLQGLNAQAGAGVVIDVKTGAILAMASRPNFDSNLLVPPVSATAVSSYLNPPNGVQPPMMNRAISGRYPPGSTFKPITGMAALESGNLTINTHVYCDGAYHGINPPILCWVRSGHGDVSLISAMAGSCNTFFVNAGRLAGVDMLDKVGHEFGLDAKTGLDLPGETDGNLPSPAYKKARYASSEDKTHQEKLAEIDKNYNAQLTAATSDSEKKKIENRRKIAVQNENERYRIQYNFYTNWHLFDTLNMSIGQGDDQFTPIELVNYVATLANDGNRMKPYLVQRIEDSNGNTVATLGSTVVHKVAVSENSMALVRMAMEHVAQPGGTAYGLFTDLPFKVAAKTGTAEMRGSTNGVFVAYAPATNPQIAFAGVIEYGLHGSETAGPVSHDVFKQYFGLNQPAPVAQSAPVQNNTTGNQPRNQRKQQPAGSQGG
jgi:penicillin-binding protein 2